nr:MAG TPA: hypothetical protein [Caudoviricetes sp.]
MRRHFSFSIVSHFARFVLFSCTLFSPFGIFLDNLVFSAAGRLPIFVCVRWLLWQISVPSAAASWVC